METIRKKICLEDFISRRPGIMPYVKKDCDDTSINYINTITSDSNYGNFPCDIAVIDSKEYIDGVTGMSHRVNKELKRFRYCDIINRYAKCLESIKNGVIVRRVYYRKEDTVYIDCIEPENTNIVYSDSYRWTTTNTSDYSFFDCIPVDVNFFYLEGNSNYYINDDVLIRHSELLNKQNTEDGLTEEEQKEFEKLSYFVGTDGVLFGDNNEKLILVDNYDEIMLYDTYWSNWWETSYSLCTYFNQNVSWEQVVFDGGYVSPNNFKFLYDVEKYIIGRIRVPEKNGNEVIEGTKTPNYLYYLTFDEYKKWFDENALEVENDHDVKKEWDSLGGQAFYNFLNSIRPYFLDNFCIPENGSAVLFCFVPANVEIPISLVDEATPEPTYMPYEVSVNTDNELFDGTSVFETPEHGIGSALTPSFKTFDYDVTVESKLDELFSDKTYYLTDDLYGVFETFGSGGCLFSCTYKTGVSSLKKKEMYFSGTTFVWGKVNGEWTVVKERAIPETFHSTIQEERPPKVGETRVYQSVLVSRVESNVTKRLTNVSNDTINLEGNIYVTGSTYAYYTKETEYSYEWWNCKKVSVSDYSLHSCGDGENLDFGSSSKYRNLLLLSCVPSASDGTGGTYYYMVKYDNGYTSGNSNTYVESGTTLKRLSLPYVLGKKVNVRQYNGDFQDTIVYDELYSNNVTISGDSSFITLKYVIGATSGCDMYTSGIHYEESYIYYGDNRRKIFIDNMYEGDVFFEKIDRDSCLTYVYSDDYDETREAYLAKITGMEIGTQWTSASCVNAYLYTDDCSDNLLEIPKVNVDISYERGNAAVWEKRFKLSECNTLEDLENYGNNYFKI